MRIIRIAAAFLLAFGAAVPVHAVTISEISQEKVSQTVTITGTLEAYRASGSERAPHSWSLKDATGTIRVCVWPDVFNALPFKDQLTRPVEATVKARVNEFRGNIELHVQDVSGVQVTGVPAAAPTPAVAATTPTAAAAATPAARPASSAPAAPLAIAAVTNEKIGQEVILKGRVSAARKPSSDRAPYVITLTDGSASVDVVFWTDLAQQLKPEQQAAVGDTMEVRGTVGEHRGQLQVRVQAADHIKVTKGAAPAAVPAGPEASAPAAKSSLGEAATAPSGSRLEITASVESIKPLRAGREIVLNDEGTTAKLLLWDTALGLKPAALNLRKGSQLTVNATAADHDGGRVLFASKSEDLIAVRP